MTAGQRRIPGPIIEPEDREPAPFSAQALVGERYARLRQEGRFRKEIEEASGGASPTAAATSPPAAVAPSPSPEPPTTSPTLHAGPPGGASATGVAATPKHEGPKAAQPIPPELVHVGPPPRPVCSRLTTVAGGASATGAAEAGPAPATPEPLLTAPAAALGFRSPPSRVPLLSRRVAYTGMFVPISSCKLVCAFCRLACEMLAFRPLFRFSPGAVAVPREVPVVHDRRDTECRLCRQHRADRPRKPRVLFLDAVSD